MARVATGTSNDGAKVLELHIDMVGDYREFFDDFYFDGLDNVAQEIDKIESEMVKQIEEKDDIINELENEIYDLKNQLEELQ